MKRRQVLAGFASLPLGGITVPLPARATDPFAEYHAEVVALLGSIAGERDDAACDPFMRRWGEIDRLAMAGRPTTLAGALGAVEYARREFHQFFVEVAAEPAEVGTGHALILHLLDGAAGVLRQAIERGRT